MNIINHLNNKLPKGSFARNLLMLVTGSGIAQAIPILLSPILTRLYSPEDFGLLAIYLSISAIASVIVTGKYELAIVPAKSDKEAIGIMVFSAFLVVTLSLFILLIISLFKDYLFSVIDYSGEAYWIYLVPLSTLVTGFQQLVIYWLNRKRQYKVLATNQALNTGVAGTLQLVGGGLAGGGVFLVIGKIFGQFISTVNLIRRALKINREMLTGVSFRGSVETAKRHIDYPKYMLLGAVINVTSGYMPIILTTFFYGAGLAGQYSLGYRILIGPMALVSQAICYIFRQEAADLYHENGDCRDIFLKTFKRLALFAFVLMIPIVLLGPTIFPLVFGSEWDVAGEIASVIGVMVFFQTISSPLSQTVLLANMQKLDFIWQAARFVLSVASYCIGYFVFESFKASIALHAMSFSLLYLVHSYMQYWAAKGGSLGTTNQELNYE